MTPAYDAVVIGCGAGGAAAAWRLAEHGLEVLVLEAGPRFDPARDYRLHLPDWELTGFPHKAGSAGRVSFAELDALDGKHDDLRSWNRVAGRTNKGARRLPSGIGYHHVRGVGGSTLHFTGEAHRLHPDAMRMKSAAGVAVDWPVGYADLEPYYAIAERLLGVAGPEDTAPRWRSAPYPLPAHWLCKASLKLAQTSRAGMDWVANPRAALSQPYDGRPACNYCGNCGRGCPISDKGSADVTFVRHAEKSGRCEVKSGAAAVVLETRGSGVRAVQYVMDGRGHRVEAPIVVLAGGAVETPRLLLANRSSRHPHGLANASDQVGRNFMETLHWVSTGLAPQSLASHEGLPADAICWNYNAPNGIRGIAGGCRFTSSTQETGFTGPISYASRIVRGFGPALKRGVREAFGRALTVGALGEFLPNERTRVTLDEANRDERGMPLAKIDARLTSLDVVRLAFMAERCRESLQDAGAIELVEEYGSYDYFSAPHVSGTCRMGRDPRTSVVDAFGRAHELSNLYIADASIFPTAGGGEGPSLTIQALAIRTADHIAKKSVLPPSTPPRVAKPIVG